MLIRFFRNKENIIPDNSYEINDGVSKLTSNEIEGDGETLKSFIKNWNETYPNGKVDFINK